MNFDWLDLNWFVTIPGVLITGGILLILLAITIFISAKSKGNSSRVEKTKVSKIDNVAPVNISNEPVNEMDDIDRKLAALEKNGFNNNIVTSEQNSQVPLNNSNTSDNQEVPSINSSVINNEQEQTAITNEEGNVEPSFQFNQDSIINQVSSANLSKQENITTEPKLETGQENIATSTIKQDINVAPVSIYKDKIVPVKEQMIKKQVQEKIVPTETNYSKPAIPIAGENKVGVIVDNSAVKVTNETTNGPQIPEIAVIPEIKTTSPEVKPAGKESEIEVL